LRVLALVLGRPLLVEGERASARRSWRDRWGVARAELVRLQCYEGLDARRRFTSGTTRQLLHVRAGDQVGDLYADEFARTPVVASCQVR